jgi:hypothetical protein
MNLHWLCLTKKQIKVMETAEVRFHGAVAGHRVMDHKGNEDTREELRITAYQYNNKRLSENG